MDPSAARYSVKGAPQQSQAAQKPDVFTAVSQTSGESQTSLQIKSTRKEKDAVLSRKSASPPEENTLHQPAADEARVLR